MKQTFSSNYWGRVRQFELPRDIVQQDKIILGPAALSGLLVLFDAAKMQHRRIENRSSGASVQVSISHSTIYIRSGYGKNTVSAALDELEQRGFILKHRSRNERGEFATKSYTLSNPLDRRRLVVGEKTNILLNNNLRYFPFPTALMKSTVSERTIAKMSGSELRVYVLLCWLANKHRNHSFDVTASELKKLTGLSTLKLVREAIERLEGKNLLIDLGGYVKLYDPVTAEPIHVEDGDPTSDPRNYWTTKAEGEIGKKWNPTMADPNGVERFLRQFGAEPVPQSNGDFYIRCPYHNESTPSCSLSPGKTCFKCFGCQKKGTMTELFMKLSGMDEGSTRRRMAELSGDVLFLDPLHKAEAVYQYFDKNRALIKEVIRHANKRFTQRRPSPVGGWIPNVDGIGPVLYNLHELTRADVVCICEGEKDCDSLSKQELFDLKGNAVIATTSGNAESWVDRLADDLKGKKIILLPDADEAGQRYRAAVEGSLQSRQIDYRVRTFADVGAKDVSEFLATGGSKRALVQRIGKDWVAETQYARYESDHEGSVADI